MTERRMKSDQVRTNWRDVLDHVRSGGTVIVEHYNRPVARITPLEDTMASRTEYALCWESAGPESAWVIRVRKPSMSDWDLWMSNPVEDLDEDDYQYAKQWAEECLALEEGLTVEGWKHDKDGDWIPLFA